MADSQTILMTGATSGLGLKVVEQLAQNPQINIIVGARNPQQAKALRSAMPADRLTILPLDLSSFASVRSFAQNVMTHLQDRTLSAVALNAGIQITTGLEYSIDGYEKTFASNYLGHFLLTHLLLPKLSPHAVVISTASGTHDPKDKISGLFGFRGAVWPSLEAVVKGTLDDSVNLRQQCLDRYATSKLCNVLFTYAMAQRLSERSINFLAFDPGLMPGTELARDRGAMEQFAWRYILPLLGYVVPGISSPERSAKTLAALLTSSTTMTQTGQHFDYRGQPTRTSELSYRQDYQDQLYDLSLALMKSNSID